MESASSSTQNKRWADDKSSFGFRMLQKMGWKEGNGLGKEQQGSKSHIVAKKKVERMGLGVSKDPNGFETFSTGISNFHSILKKLHEHHGVQKSKEKPKEEEKPVEKTDKVRYHKHLKAKSVRDYSSHDLAAILGRPSSASTAPVVFDVPDAKTPSSLTKAEEEYEKLKWIYGTRAAGQKRLRSRASSDDEEEEEEEALHKKEQGEPAPPKKDTKKKKTKKAKKKAKKARKE